MNITITTFPSTSRTVSLPSRILQHRDGAVHQTHVVCALTKLQKSKTDTLVVYTHYLLTSGVLKTGKQRESPTKSFQVGD